MAEYEQYKRGGRHMDDDDEDDHYRHGGRPRMEEASDEDEGEESAGSSRQMRPGEGEVSDRELDAEGGSARRPRRARGGASTPRVHWYNAEGSPTEEAVRKGSDGFGRGGR